MNTNKFLLNYLTAEARVTICNDRGSILYEGELGELGELRVALTRHTRIKSIEGLGSQDDIIITVTAEY